MKRCLIFLLSLLLCFANSSSFGRESLEDHAKNTDELYRVGVGAKDGAYTATSTSMFGWGIALFIAIAIIVATVHYSAGKTSGSS